MDTGKSLIIGSDSSSFETFVYRIPLPGGGEQYFPEAPPQARVAFTVIGIPRTVGVDEPAWAGQLDVRTSPNPGTHGVWIDLALPASGLARVSIMDLAGRNVATLMEAIGERGPMRLRWDARNTSGSRCSAGVYWCRVEFDRKTVSRCFVLLRGQP